MWNPRAVNMYARDTELHAGQIGRRPTFCGWWGKKTKKTHELTAAVPRLVLITPEGETKECERKETFICGGSRCPVTNHLALSADVSPCLEETSAESN